ncbi:MAG: hypothetical protein ICV61_03170, partial [Microcoleus sp. Co-bin12]|nr:hypothetical protein [Microcoleus sp. Co-bin12]
RSPFPSQSAIARLPSQISSERSPFPSKSAISPLSHSKSHAGDRPYFPKVRSPFSAK